MAICPVCQNSLPDDFGLIECSQCGAPLFVEMDGSVQHQTMEPAREFTEDDFEQPPVPAVEELYESQEAEPEFEPPEAFEDPSMEPEPLEAPVEEPPPSDLPADSFSLDDLEQAPEPDLSVASAEVSNSSSDLSDLSQFANSEASGGRDGNLRYNVLVEGIDTSDIRDGFKDVIGDRRFLWDAERILRSIKDGRVTIENVSAVKALLLVHRLRSLPLQIKWEQYAIQQA